MTHCWDWRRWRVCSPSGAVLATPARVAAAAVRVAGVLAGPVVTTVVVVHARLFGAVLLTNPLARTGAGMTAAVGGAGAAVQAWLTVAAGRCTVTGVWMTGIRFPVIAVVPGIAVANRCTTCRITVTMITASLLRVAAIADIA